MSLTKVIPANEYIFSEKHYIFLVNWISYEKSQFDLHLQASWSSKESLFRYKLKIDEEKKIDGMYGFLAKLNLNRAVNRRPPEDIRSVNQPFSNDRFNFTNVTVSEIMFTLVKEGVQQDSHDSEKDYILINVSPLDNCNCLLCPSLNKCLNQIVTEKSLYLALNVILLSSSPEIRTGFNSLCAYATVNHLHFHAYYLNVPMRLETIKVEFLAGRCYVLEEFPSKGFVFQLTSPTDIDVIVKDIFRLTNFLTNENIAHNIYMTRGLKFERSAFMEDTTERDVVRIYVWARVSSCGAKTLDAFNPALCELFGHLVVKTKEEYDKLDEKSIANILHSITNGPYTSIKEKVKKLFQ